MEWRKEIEEAIRGCNKFVAFIDLQYLLSFNCIEVSPWDLSPGTDAAGENTRNDNLSIHACSSGTRVHILRQQSNEC